MMADRTPKKAARERKTELCRCCAKKIDEVYDRICIFGCKSEAEEILDLIKHFGGIEILDGDGLPKHICRSCCMKLKNMSAKAEEFKKKCRESEQKFKDERFKRCRKDNEPDTASSSPPSVMQVSKKARHSSARMSLHQNLVKIAPKPLSSTESLSSTISEPMATEITPYTCSRVLPPEFQNPTGENPKNEEGLRILSCSGLENKEVNKNYKN
jgi:hypothetical protein